MTRDQKDELLRHVGRLDMFRPGEAGGRLIAMLLEGAERSGLEPPHVLARVVGAIVVAIRQRDVTPRVANDVLVDCYHVLYPPHSHGPGGDPTEAR